MSFLNWFIKPEKPELRNDNEVQEVTTESIYSHPLLFNSSQSWNSNKAMLLSAVFRAVEILSNSVSEMPIVITKLDSKGNKVTDKDHVLFTLLNRKPSKRLNKFNFFKLLIINTLLTGNGYSWIKRDSTGKVTELIFLPSDMVSVISHNVFDEIKYQVAGVKSYISAKDMIHILNIPGHDGEIGISTLQYARKTLSLNDNEMGAAKSFFESGNCKAGILTADRPLNEAQEDQIKSNWQQTFGSNNGVPTTGVVILKSGLKYESIQVSPQDAELLESRKFSVAEIARYFGVPLSLMFDNSTNSYASQEAEAINFLTHSITPLLDKIETELNDKLWSDVEWMQGYQMKFDSSVLLRTDKKSLADYYQKMFQMGVLSPNDIRHELDLNPIENGDKHWLQVNIAPMDKIANQPIEQNPTASNQLKGEDNTDNQEEGGTK